MQKYFFYLFLISILVSTTFISASLNLAPGKLSFNLDPGVQDCQNITLIAKNYSGPISIRDVWTNEKNQYNINKFNLSKDDLGVEVLYNSKIEETSERQEVEICLKPNKSGSYLGDIIFTPLSDTNVVVESGAWLFVNVSGEVKEETQVQEKIITNTGDGITGNVVSESSGSENLWWIIGVIIIIIVAFVVTYYIKRKIRWKNYGY
jgi:hypothetical protein